MTGCALYTLLQLWHVYKTGILGGGSRLIIGGFLVIIFGSLGAWLIAALLLRAFGDLSVDTKAIRERLETSNPQRKPKQPAEAKPRPRRRGKSPNPES